MSASDDLSVVRRMAGAARRQAAAATRSPAHVLSEAIVKAAERSLGLMLTPQAADESLAPRDAALSGIDSNGLFVLLSDAEGTFGLLVLDAGLLASVIEMLTCGVTAAQQPAARRASRIDAALASDLVDAILGLFDPALADLPKADWARGFRQADMLNKPATAALVLENGGYRKLTVRFGFGETGRSGGAVLIVPSERRRLGDGAQRAAVQAADWQARLRRNLVGAEVPLRAVLWRIKQPLSALQGLQAGTVVPLPLSAVGQVSLIGLDGRSVASGRLGQSMGRKAVRIMLGETPAAEAPIAPLRPGPPKPSAALPES